MSIQLWICFLAQLCFCKSGIAFPESLCFSPHNMETLEYLSQDHPKVSIIEDSQYCDATEKEVSLIYRSPL